MIKEISYQTDAVGELVEKTISLLNASGSRKKLVFKAPTGSGKTVMASQMLDELTTQLADRRTRSSPYLDRAQQAAPTELPEDEELLHRNPCAPSRDIR